MDHHYHHHYHYYYYYSYYYTTTGLLQDCYTTKVLDYYRVELLENY